MSPPPALRANIATDLLLTAWLATPLLAEQFFALISWFGVATGLHPPLAPFGAFEMMMIHLAGILGVAWNAMRLRGLWRELWVADLLSKLAFSAVIVGYVAFAGVTPIALLFVLSELLGGWTEWQAVRAAAPA